MKLIRLMFVVIVLLVWSAVVLAEENTVDGKNHLVGEINMDLYSRYVCGTSGAIAYNRPVIQGSVKLSLEPLGFYAKFWGSGSMTQDGGNKCGNEYDLIVGIARSVGIFKVDLAYGYFDLYPQFRGRGDLHAFFGTISYPNKIVEPYITIEWDVPTAKKALEGGVYYRAGITKSIDLYKNLVLIGDLSVGGNDGPFGFRPDFFAFARGGLSLCWSPWKNFSMTPQIYYQKRLGHHPSEGGITGDAFWAGVSFSFKHDILSF